MNRDDEHSARPVHRRHLWEFVAFRDLCWILAVLAALWLLWSLWGVLLPILVAFALAYVVNPLVRRAQQGIGVPRFATALFLLLVFFAALTALAIWALPHLGVQIEDLGDRIPDYVEAVHEELVHLGFLAENGGGGGEEENQGKVDPESLINSAAMGAESVLGLLGGVLGTVTWLVVFLLLAPTLFVWFAVHFDRMPELAQFLPASRRERILHVLGVIDAAFSGYVRGQLVVALFTTLGFCLGFWLVDVPYWFIVSLIGGALSVVPYGQCTGWLLAILFQFGEVLTGNTSFVFFDVVLAPTLVYLCTQSMETWVVTPLAQGEATELHPIAVLVALILGGSLLGILGLILAVPVTASARTLFQEFALPRWRRWAASR